MVEGDVFGAITLERFGGALRMPAATPSRPPAPHPPPRERAGEIGGWEVVAAERDVGEGAISEGLGERPVHADRNPRYDSQSPHHLISKRQESDSERLLQSG